VTNNVAKPRGLDETLLGIKRRIGMAMRSLDEGIGFRIILQDRQNSFWRWIIRSREKIEFLDCRPATRSQRMVANGRSTSPSAGTPRVSDCTWHGVSRFRNDAIMIILKEKGSVKVKGSWKKEWKNVEWRQIYYYSMPTVNLDPTIISEDEPKLLFPVSQLLGSLGCCQTCRRLKSKYGACHAVP
jgi:hypothetical protein